MKATFHIAILSKAPIAGAVKTRLIPAIGPERAAELHHRLLGHTLRTVCEAGYARSLWVAGEVAHPAMIDASHHFGIALHRQEGPDLGARMKHAMRLLLERAESAALIGTDCPVLESSHFEQVSAALRSGVEVVLIPAEDGGYVLIGAMLHSERRDAVLNALFDDMPWSTDRIMSLTRERLRSISATWHELPCLWDIDRPGDLLRLETIALGADVLHQ
ncbi:MAG: glycosyltransferase [Paraburkholderia sp.]|nr:MAG: glycosyltransferase [Paraburkholderia sp.]